MSARYKEGEGAKGTYAEMSKLSMSIEISVTLPAASEEKEMSAALEMLSALAQRMVCQEGNSLFRVGSTDSDVAVSSEDLCLHGYRGSGGSQFRGLRGHAEYASQQDESHLHGQMAHSFGTPLAAVGAKTTALICTTVVEATVVTSAAPFGAVAAVSVTCVVVDATASLLAGTIFVVCMVFSAVSTLATLFLEVLEDILRKMCRARVPLPARLPASTYTSAYWRVHRHSTPSARLHSVPSILYAGHSNAGSALDSSVFLNRTSCTASRVRVAHQSAALGSSIAIRAAPAHDSEPPEPQ